jgi:hypothetical protein
VSIVNQQFAKPHLIQGMWAAKKWNYYHTKQGVRERKRVCKCARKRILQKKEQKIVITMLLKMQINGKNKKCQQESLTSRLNFNGNIHSSFIKHL